MQLRLIWERSRDGMRLTDADGRIVMVNESFCRMVNLPESRLVGAPFSVAYAKRHQSQMLKAGIRRFQTREVEPCLIRDVETWDGRLITLEVSNAFVELDGQPPLLLSICRDITDRRRTEEALRHAKEYSENLIASAPLLVARLDRFGRIRVLNRVAEEVTGYTRHDLAGTNWLRLLLPRERYPRIWSLFRHRSPNSHGFSAETPILTRSGEERVILWNCSEIRQEGRVVGLVAFGTDVTEQRSTEIVLQRYQLLLEHSSDIMLLLHPDGSIVEANRAAERTYGYSREQLLSKRMSDLRDRREDRRLLSTLRQPQVNADLFYTSHRRHDGSTFPVEVSSQAATVGSERVILCVIRDISERIALEEELAHRAFHDPLTGLANRALFLDRLTHALAGLARRQDRVAVLYLDLDRFKLINDSLGHEAGDELLVAVASRICSCLRAADTAARQGGDEFTVLLEAVHSERDVIRVAERILRRLNAPFRIQGRDVFVSASIGIAVSHGLEDPPNKLMKEADVAMYQVKERGKSGYAVFRRELNSHALDRLDMETDLRHAIERGEFQVFYQPIIRLDTGRVAGLEALVRWNRPRFGMLTPDQFLPVQEQLGLMEPLALWVIREALRQHSRLSPVCPGLYVSVNLAAVNVHDEAFPGKVEALLDPKGVPLDWLRMEFTEAAMATGPREAIENLHRLNALGIRLSIDDFGTGYTSLLYLRQLPVHDVKINNSFIRDLHPDAEDDQAIVRSTLDLAHSLRKEVVAEGVEDIAVWEMLHRLGCDAAQGYYMGPPMPEGKLDRWLASSPFGLYGAGVRPAGSTQV